MNKSELIEQVAERADIKRSEAESAVNALTEVVKETLQRGGDVAITGFGKFSVAERGGSALGREPGVRHVLRGGHRQAHRERRIGAPGA